jgi:bifunctional non-homologous end joining protein LigD
MRGVQWPTVAAPLTWEEVEQAVANERPERLMILANDVPSRLDRYGDIFEPLLQVESELGPASET